jgi:hypothetical protein
LRNPATHETVTDVRMQIDTGSDLTLVPKSAVDRLGMSASRIGAYELAGFDGRTSTADVLAADLLFLGHSFHGEFVLTDEDCGILGRNILNHFSILFDGPNSRWVEIKLP